LAWVADLHGQIVGLDTAPLIYYLETHPTYLPLVDPFFNALAQGELQVVTSVITLIEVLVVPLRQGNTALAARYRELLLTSQGLTMHPLSTSIAEDAARLRATYTIRTPDAVQIATTLAAGAGAFLTNDARLAAVRELRVVVLEDLLAAGEGTNQESADHGPTA
jgi:predicted nucleic acid-binding protein